MCFSSYDFEGFVGDFSELLIEFVQMKQAMGYNYSATADALKRFSKFTLQFKIENQTLTKDLADAWTAKRANEKDVTQSKRLNDLKQFAVFLSNLGFDAYIPVCKAKINRHSHVPYIFTAEQLRLFFSECDRIKPHPLSNKHLLLPLLYRLLFGCGLRISEAVALKLKNVDFKKGVITIRHSKHDKDRYIPISPTLTKCMQSYYAIMHGVSTPEDYYFMKKDRSAIAANTVYKNFRMILWRSGISHGGKGRGPRLHDLRHNFAVYSLNQMIRQEVDLYCALPVLSTYLGHASVAATERYIRLTEEVYPDILDKTNRHCSYVFPEVKCE